MNRYIPRRNRRSQQIQNKTLSKRQTFELESLESRLLLSVSPLGVPDWTPLGPGPITNAGNVDNAGANDSQVGAIEAIAVDPANAAHVAIGAVNGGVWITNNINAATPNWTTNTDQLPSLAIGAVAFSPTNSNVIYAGTGSYTNGGVGTLVSAGVTTAGSGGAAVGIYRSTDGGASWLQLGASVFQGLRISDIVPTTLNGGQTVFAGTADGTPATTGVYRSDDSGVTWTRLSGGASGLPNQGITDLIADPNNANRLFATVPNGAGAGVYMLDTTGNNTTWTDISGNLPAGALSGQRILLSVSTATGNPIWAGVVNNSGFLQGVYRGVEAPAGTFTWTAVSAQPPDIYAGANQGATNFSIVADPNSNNLVYVGGDAKIPFPFAGNLARGDSNTNTWTAISRLGTKSNDSGVVLPAAGANPATTAPHADSRAMVFDGNNIIEIDDGGIYLLTDPAAVAGAPAWSALEGNLQIGEVYQVALDTANTAATTDDVYLDAQQDDGANQRSAAGAWQESVGGDGTVVLADSVNGHRYFVAENFFFRRQDGGGALVTPAATINNAGAVAGLTINDALFNPNTPNNPPLAEILPFFSPSALDAADPNRMLVGGQATLYESLDNGDTFRSIGGLDGAGRFSLAVAGLTGRVTAVAYGNPGNANLAYVADANGNLLRTTNISVAGGGFAATDFNTVAGGAAALGIVIDPNNANIAYAVTRTGVFQTTNGTNWTSLTDNILKVAQSGGVTTLASIELFNNGTATTADDVLLVGGYGGVFRRFVAAAPNPNANWTEYGAGLPNTLVTSLTYNAQADTLVAGTYGRSVWRVAGASTTIGVAGVLQIDGDTNLDDTIRLVREASNPSILDVFVNNNTSTPTKTVQMSTIEQINVNGLGGNDTLIVDSSNGLINVVDGIRYDGGTGTNDALQLVQTGGPQRISDTYTLGLSNGSGTSTIVGDPTAGTETVFFENLSPVLDTVSASTLQVVATAADNSITYGLGSSMSDGLVAIDEHESIEFSNKATLNINGGAGQDRVTLGSPITPTGLTKIVVDGGTGTADELDVTGTGAAVSVDTAVASITGALGAVTIQFSNIDTLNLASGIGDLTINSTTADDAATVTPGAAGGGANSGSVSSSGAIPQITFVNTGTFTANLDGGSDSLTVIGTSNPDTVAINESTSTVQIAGRNGVSYSGLEQLSVIGSGGADTFNVTSGAIPVFIDGGDPIGALPGDRLNILAGGASVTYNAGPQTDQGSFVVGANAPVSFDNIESFGISGSGPAIINGTNGPDTITVIARDASTNAGTDGVQDFTVSVNNGPDLLFINVGDLTLNALSGSDQVTLITPAPNNAAWNVNVTVNGGPPAADTDRLIVQTPGSSGETAVYTPSTADGGTLAVLTSTSATLANIAITGIEQLSYDGQGDNDVLKVVGTSGNDAIVLTPGANDQSGSLQVNSLLPISFQNLGGNGSITVDGGLGVDTFTYNGTAANDTFTVDGAGAIGGAGQIRLNTRLVVNTTGVENLTLEGLAGDDLFTLVPSISTSVFGILNFDGGAQASSSGDRVNLIGTSGNDAFAISGQSVSLGGRTVQSSGIEDIRLNALGGTDEITYNALSNLTENINISASSIAGSGQLTVQGVALYDVQGVESFAVNGNSGPNGTDTLTFTGTTASDLFQIHEAATGTTTDPILQLQDSTGTNTLLTLRSYTGFNTLNVLGLDGEDTFNVYVAGTNAQGTAPSRNLFIDGGTPTGKKKSTDNLNLIYTPPRPAITSSAATQDPQSGLINVNYGAARFLVQYADIEQVVIRKA
jgi:hypothetical protein